MGLDLPTSKYTSREFIGDKRTPVMPINRTPNYVKQKHVVSINL